MCQLKALLFISLLGLMSLVKAERKPNEYKRTEYPPNIIQHLLRKKFLFIPISASNSAIDNEDVYGLRNAENIQHKRYPKSVFIVYPENQRPAGQACNLKLPQTTIPPQTTVVEDHKACTHPTDEHSTATPFTVTTSCIPSTDSTTSFTSPQPINPSSLSTSTTEPTMTSAFPVTSPSKIPATPTAKTTSYPWTTPANKTPTPSIRPTISPPTIKDPTGTGEIQCSFNGLYRANNFTCDQYLVCINGVTYLMDCPYGLAFNDDKKTCDWPGNVKGCNPRAFENFECPYDLSEDNKISTFRYRDSCSQFIACYRRKPRLLKCRDGLSFDEDAKDCVNLKRMTNCKNVIYSF